MKEYFSDKVKSEDGAETIEIIIGIVVFVVFGLTVFGMITKAGGNKAASISNCFAKSGNILSQTSDNASTKTTCNDDSDTASYSYNK